MHWVLVWLSVASFLALIPVFRLSLWFGTWLWRWGHPWFALAILLLLADVIDPMEGWNDPSDPLNLIPRIIKLAWFSGLAASLPKRGKYLALPLLVWLHVAAVGFLVDIPESLLYHSAEARAAWLGESVTVLESFAHLGWVGLWGHSDGYPLQLILELIGGPIQWFLPLVLMLLLSWCWVLLRSAFLNVEPANAPHELNLTPFGFKGLSVVALLWVGSNVAGNQPIAPVLDDLWRLAWLIHVVGSLRWIRRSRLASLMPVIGGVGLLLFNVTIFFVGLIGAIGIQWCMVPESRSSRSYIRALSSWGAVISAALVFLVLRYTDFKPMDPLADRAVQGHWIQQHAAQKVNSGSVALSQCKQRNARLCCYGEWKASLIDDEYQLRKGTVLSGWEWIQLERRHGKVMGLCRLFESEKYSVPVRVNGALGESMSIKSASYRCCR